MNIKNQIKKRLCKVSSYYEDGKLVVLGHIILLYIMMGLLLMWFVLSIGTSFIMYLFTDPTKAVFLTFIIVGIVWGTFLAIWVVSKFLAWKLLTELVKRFEVTCDRVIFPEEVKAIFAQAEALNEENKAFFLKGIRPLLRKMGDEQ